MAYHVLRLPYSLMTICISLMAHDTKTVYFPFCVDIVDGLLISCLYLPGRSFHIRIVNKLRICSTSAVVVTYCLVLRIQPFSFSIPDSFEKYTIHIRSNLILISDQVAVFSS